MLNSNFWYVTDQETRIRYSLWANSEMEACMIISEQHNIPLNRLDATDYAEEALVNYTTPRWCAY